MFQLKKLITLFISIVLISIGLSPLAHADDTNNYTNTTNATDFSILLGANSTIVIDPQSVDVVNNVYTFSSYDPEISAKVSDPENYALASSGVLLQSKSQNIVQNSYYNSLTQLLTQNQIGGQSVTDLSAVAFEFATLPGENTVSLDFILASNESVQGDWDLAGIFIDGVNYAFLPNGQLLRVNTSAQITDVCNFQSFSGCYQSDFSLNGVTLGTISPKLSLNAALDSNLSTHTFVAIMANTNDTLYPSSLLLGNFQSFGVAQQFVSTFSYGIQLEEEVVVTPLIPQTPVPDPNQSSEITGVTVSTPDAKNNVTIEVKGSFSEKVRNIDVNGRRIALGDWAQDGSTVTFTMPAVTSGNYAVQIWNGSLPLLQVQTIVITNN
jgi:hypothetical protein